MSDDSLDLVIRDGTIVDGTGAPRQRGDLGIRGDRIVALGDLAARTARRTFNASGLVVAPGFIDTHTHDDMAVMLWPDMPMKVSQGVTTVIAGNCGISLAPAVLDRAPPPPLDLIGDRQTYRFASMKDYLAQLDDEPPALNLVMLVGHTSLRATVMGDLGRPADRGERLAMGRALDAALQEGAVGLSTGLFYPPARAAPAAEVVELARIVAAHDGIHCTHMRDEGDHVVASLQEAFDIGAEAGVPTLVSHHKVMGLRNHGMTRQTLPLIEAARARQPIAIDAYPYVASSTILTIERVRQSSNVIITWSVRHPEATGRTLTDLAAEFGLSPEEAIAELQPAGAIYFVMDRADVRRVLAWPETMIGSDGIPQDEFPHPRLWGSFPRVLGYYVREVGLFSLEQAVRKMTALPADAFGLRDRGLLREGAFADITVFDPAAVIDRATFTEPCRSASGIALVLVNGEPVWQGDMTTGKRPGRALRRGELHAPMLLRRSVPPAAAQLP